MSDQDQTVDPAAEEPTVSAAAVSDGAYTLLVADFSDTETAWQAYEALEEVEDGRTVEVEGVIVVKRSAEKAEIRRLRTTARSPGSSGAVGGIALGVIFPPSRSADRWSVPTCRGSREAAPASPQERARGVPPGRGRSRAFGSAGPRLGPGGRADPSSSGARRCDCRVRDRQGRSRRHQGRCQGGAGVREGLTRSPTTRRGGSPRRQPARILPSLARGNTSSRSGGDRDPVGRGVRGPADAVGHEPGGLHLVVGQVDHARMIVFPERSVSTPRSSPTARSDRDLVGHRPPGRKEYPRAGRG